MYQVEIYQDSSGKLKENIEKMLNSGWKVERADVLGKKIIYVFKLDKK